MTTRAVAIAESRCRTRWVQPPLITTAVTSTDEASANVRIRLDRSIVARARASSARVCPRRAPARPP